MPENFIFHGQTCPAGDPVNSNPDVPTWRLDWSYAYWKEGGNAWRAGVGGRLWTFDMRMEYPKAGLNERRRFDGFHPMMTSDLALDLGHGLFTDRGGNLPAATPRFRS